MNTAMRNEAVLSPYSKLNDNLLKKSKLYIALDQGYWVALQRQICRIQKSNILLRLVCFWVGENINHFLCNMWKASYEVDSSAE